MSKFRMEGGETILPLIKREEENSVIVDIEMRNDDECSEVTILKTTHSVFTLNVPSLSVLDVF